MDARRPGNTQNAPNSPPDTEWLHAKGSRLLEKLKNLGKRIAVHLLIFLSALGSAAVTQSPLVGACIYTSGICLIVPEMTRALAGFLPTGYGLLLSGLLAALYLPLAEALFWGGSAAWLLRMAWHRSRASTDWATVPLLLLLGVYLWPYSPGLVVIPALALACAIGFSIPPLLARKKRAFAKVPGAAGAKKPGDPERVAAYRLKLTTFAASVQELPRGARNAAESILASTSGILDCMAADIRDQEPGHRFLNRYFTAAQTVVDKHTSLARQREITPEIMNALVRSEDMLGRLAEAFTKERSRLLANDVTDFSADLAVIDTLLDMDGR